MEGTLAHELAELELKLALGYIEEEEYLERFKPIVMHELYSDEMTDEVDKYVQIVLSQIEDLEDPIISIEEKIDLTEFIPEGFGSNDNVIIADRILYVNDLKYGKGVKVHAHKNSQLMLYGLGSLIKYDFIYDVDKVVLTIIQPRLNHVDSYEISAEELKHWGENVVKAKAQKAFKGEGELVPGDHCKFCKVSAKCKAIATKNLELAKYEFRDPHLMTTAELADVYEAAQMLVDWVGAVEKYMFQQLLKGEKIEGFKLVEGRSNRVFTNPELAAAKLIELGFDEDIIYKKSLQGISVIEKAIGKKAFNESLSAYVSKPTGKPTMVPLSDSRPEFKSTSAISDFTD